MNPALRAALWLYCWLVAVVDALSRRLLRAAYPRNAFLKKLDGCCVQYDYTGVVGLLMALAGLRAPVTDECTEPFNVLQTYDAKLRRTFWVACRAGVCLSADECCAAHRACPKRYVVTLNEYNATAAYNNTLFLHGPWTANDVSKALRLVSDLSAVPRHTDEYLWVMDADNGCEGAWVGGDVVAM